MSNIIAKVRSTGLFSILALLILLFSVFAPILPLQDSGVSIAHATTWLTDYANRQAFETSHATGVLSNYQRYYTVHKGAGASSGTDIYLASHSLNWPYDIRFTTSDGATLLDYWRESNDANTAYIWVEFNSIGTSATLFYVYYGFAAGADVSSGTNTFPFFDTFTGVTINTDIWTGNTSKTTVSGGIMTLTSTASSADPVQAGGSVGGSTPTASRQRASVTSGAGVWTTINYGGNGGSESNYFGDLFGAVYVGTYNADTGSASASDWTTGAYHIYDIVRESAAHVHFFQDGAEVAGSPRTEYINTGTLYPRFMTYNLNPILVDWTLVRSYAVVEPTDDSWAAEEGGGGAPGLGGYAYRQGFYMSRASGAVSNYPLPVTVVKGAGSSTGSTVYFNSHALSWPDDVRFTNSDGTTELPYWVEEYDASDQTVWVNFDSIGVSATLFYIYYGKAGDASMSNGVTTFTLFDNFNDASIDGAKWAIRLGTPVEAGGLLTCTGTLQETLESLATFQYKRMRALFKFDTVIDGGSFGFDDNNGGLAPNYEVIWATGANTTSTTTISGLAEVTNRELHEIGPYNGAWHTGQIDWSNWQAKFYIDNDLKRTDVAFVTNTTAPAQISCYQAAGKTEIDWIFVSNYYPTEPAFGTWILEGGAAPTVTTTTPAASITSSSAVVGGTLTYLGNYTTFYASVEYGFTTAYGSNTTDVSLTEIGSWTQGLTGLASGQLYHFRARIRYNPTDYVFGADVTFTTTSPYGNWLGSFGDRQKFQVVGAASLQTNYQVKLEVYKEASTPSSINQTYQGIIDSLPFVRSTTNPIVVHGAPGNWKSQMAYDPFVLPDKNDPTKLIMFFSGCQPTCWAGASIATASASIDNPTVWTENPNNPILPFTSAYPQPVLGVRVGTVVVYNNLYYIFHTMSKLESQQFADVGVATWDGVSARATDSLLNPIKTHFAVGDISGPEVWLEGSTWVMNYGTSLNTIVWNATSTSPFGPYTNDVVIAVPTLYPVHVTGASYLEFHRTIKLDSLYVMVFESVTYADNPGGTYQGVEIQMAWSTAYNTSYTMYPSTILGPSLIPGTSDYGAVATSQYYWDTVHSRWLLFYSGCEWIEWNNCSAPWDLDMAIGGGGSSEIKVSLNGHSLNWPNDIRFTTSDTTTKMDYWVESYDSTMATIWIEVPNIPTVGTTCYAYYGLADAVSESSGTNTFPFFDDFPGTTLDPSWTGNTTAASVAGGIMTFADPAGTGMGLYGGTSQTLPGAFRTKAKFIVQAADYSWMGFAELAPPGDDYNFFYNDNGVAKITSTKAGVGTTPTSDWTGGAYDILDILRESSSSAKYYENGRQVLGSPITTNVGTGALNARIYVNSSSINVDWVLFRKYIGSGPYVSTWYTEETLGVGVRTDPATGISVPNAILWGYITALGPLPCTERGMDWGTTIAYGTSWTETSTSYTVGPFSHSITGLAAGTYHFRAKAYTASGWVVGYDHTFTVGTVGIETSDAAEITSSTATLQGSISSMGGMSPIYVYFEYGSTSSYGTSTPEETKLLIGGFAAPITGLSSGVSYHFRAVGRYSGSNRAYGDDVTFTASSAAPSPPTGFSSAGGTTTIALTWTAGTGSSRTMVRYATDAYPTTISSGTLLYLGVEGNVTFTSPTPGTTYYFSAWGEAGGVYSTTYVLTSNKAGVAGELDPPTQIAIDTVFIYKDYNSPGSIILVVSYKLLYTTNPIEEVGDYFVFQVREGATLRTQFLPTDWGYQPSSLYQASVGSLVWGRSYTLALTGRADKWTAPPTASRTISLADYKGNFEEKGMADWVIKTAQKIAPTGTPYVYPVQGKGLVLTDTGAIIFEDAIPGLRSQLPKLFSTGVLGLNADTGVYTNTYEQTLNMTTALGPETAGALNTLGGYLGISGQTVATFGWVFIVLCVVGGFAVGGGVGSALLVGAPIIALGLALATISLTNFLILGALIVVYALYVLIMK